MTFPMNSVYHPPTLLLQDESKGLSRWFASRLGSKHQITMSKDLPILPAAKIIIGPAEGWQTETLYLVEVAISKNNPIHTAYLKVGFRNGDGQPGNYSEVWNNSYDGPRRISEVYYLKVIKTLHTEEQ